MKRYLILAILIAFAVFFYVVAEHSVSQVPSTQIYIGDDFNPQPKE